MCVCVCVRSAYSVQLVKNVCSKDASDILVHFPTIKRLEIDNIFLI